MRAARRCRRSSRASCWCDGRRAPRRRRRRSAPAAKRCRRARPRCWGWSRAASPTQRRRNAWASCCRTVQSHVRNIYGKARRAQQDRGRVRGAPARACCASAMRAGSWTGRLGGSAVRWIVMLPGRSRPQLLRAGFRGKRAGVLTLDTAHALLEPDGGPPREGDGRPGAPMGPRVSRSGRSCDLPHHAAAAQSACEPMAVLFSRVGNQVHVLVNGSTVQRWGVLGDPLFDATKTMRMVTLPAGLLHADRPNELRVEVTIQAQRLGGLSVVRYGPVAADRRSVHRADPLARPRHAGLRRRPGRHGRAHRRAVVAAARSFLRLVQRRGAAGRGARHRSVLARRSGAMAAAGAPLPRSATRPTWH